MATAMAPDRADALNECPRQRERAFNDRLRAFGLSCKIMPDGTAEVFAAGVSLGIMAQGIESLVQL